MSSTLTDKLKLFKSKIREEIESSTKAAKDKVLKKVTPTLLSRHPLFIEKVNEETFDNSSWTEVVKGGLSNKLKLITVASTTVIKGGVLIFPSKKTQGEARAVLEKEKT